LYNSHYEREGQKGEGGKTALVLLSESSFWKKRDDLPVIDRGVCLLRGKKEKGKRWSFKDLLLTKNIILERKRSSAM